MGWKVCENPVDMPIRDVKIIAGPMCPSPYGAPLFDKCIRRPAEGGAPALLKDNDDDVEAVARIAQREQRARERFGQDDMRGCRGGDPAIEIVGQKNAARRPDGANRGRGFDRF